MFVFKHDLKVGENKYLTYEAKVSQQSFYSLDRETFGQIERGRAESPRRLRWTEEVSPQSFSLQSARSARERTKAHHQLHSCI